MKASRLTVAALVLFLVGIGGGELCFKGGPSASRAPSSPEPPPLAEPAGGGAGFADMDRAIRDSPQEVLKAIQSNPYLPLTPDHIPALASSFDLSSKRDRSQLNQVVPPQLKVRLWNECIRLKLGSVPLQTFARYIEESGMGMRTFPVFLDAIASAPDRDRIFASEWMEPHLNGAVTYFAGQTDDLQELLKLLPAEIVDNDLNELMVKQWSYAHPKGENLKAVIEVAPSLPQSMKLIHRCALNLCSFESHERAEVITQLTHLPDNSRNRILDLLINEIGAGDLSLSAHYLSSFTSYVYQESAAKYLLERKDEETKARLIKELDALPDQTSVRKLRAFLAEKAEGKQSE